MRWHMSRCMPRLSARMDLITSPCEQIDVDGFLAQPLVPVPDRRRPRGPACRAWTRRRRGSAPRSGAPAPPATAVPWPASSAAGRSSPRSGTRRRAHRAGPSAAGPRARRRSPARSAWHRSSGLVMIASSGTAASRAPSASACARPRSSREMPGVQPVSAVPVGAVRPCRTTRTKVTARLYGVPGPTRSPPGRLGMGGSDTAAAVSQETRRPVRARSRQPKLTRSPARTGTGPVTRQPLSLVPFVEPEVGTAASPRRRGAGRRGCGTRSCRPGQVAGSARGRW